VGGCELMSRKGLSITRSFAAGGPGLRPAAYAGLLARPLQPAVPAYGLRPMPGYSRDLCSRRSRLTACGLCRATRPIQAHTSLESGRGVQAHTSLDRTDAGRGRRLRL